MNKLYTDLTVKKKCQWVMIKVHWLDSGRNNAIWVMIKVHWLDSGNWGMIKVHWLDCGRKNARGRRWISSSASQQQKTKARRREASLLGAQEDGVLPLPNLPRRQRAARRQLETKKGQRSRERKRRRSNWLFPFLICGSIKFLSYKFISLSFQ